jgi:FkbM family methyltransferase
MSTKELEGLFNIGEINELFDFRSCNHLFKTVFLSERFKSKEGDKVHDFSTLYKMLILQRLFGLETDHLHYTITDRRSWMAFLNATDAGELPSLPELEEFRYKLRKSGIDDDLFSQFDRAMADHGIVLQRGHIKELSAVAIAPSGLDQPRSGDKSRSDRISEIYVPGIQHPIHIRFGTSDEVVFREILLEKGYNFQVDGTPEFIVDCGANIGLASIFFRNRFPSTHIIAVEPEDSNFRLLEHNLSYYYPQVECLRNGIWNCNTELAIKNLKTSGKWGFVVGERESIEEDSVSSITINDILKKYNRESIDILKVDIEGAEVELFSSNYDYWLPKTKAILIETHDRSRKGCSQSFFRAIANFDFSISYKGNTMLCVRD